MHYTKQHPVFFGSAEDAVSQIKSGDTVAIGGFWFVRIPVALVDALIKRGVNNLTVITHCSGLALDQLIAAKLVKKVIFSFSSMDLFGLSPFLRKAIENKEIDWEEWTALRMVQSLDAGRQNLPSLMMRPPMETDLNAESEDYKVEKCPLTGETIAYMRALQPDVALIHAQKADQQGNIQICGTQGMDRLLIGASKQTFVSVEEIVSADQFDSDPRSIMIPHFLINRICQLPGGAYPSSCLPYYIVDYWQISHVLETAKQEGNYDSIQKPATEELQQRLTHLQRFTTVEVNDFVKAVEKQYPPESKDKEYLDEDYSIDELMASLLADEIKNDMVSTVGSNTPLSMVAYLLAKKTHAPDVVLIPFTGLNDITVFPITLSLAEVFAYKQSTSHWSIEDLWQWMYQKSLVAVEFGSTAQIDKYGRINNSIIGTPDKIKVRLPGQAGLADVMNFHHNSLFYITRQDRKRMVESVDFISGVRYLLSENDRRKANLADGVLKVFTNLGIFELEREKRLMTLTHIHPGVKLEEIQENTGFQLEVSAQLQTTKPPRKHQLHLIRNVIDPFGFRKLEFLAGKDRLAMINEILLKEQQILFGKQLLPGIL